jgi:hypothetical protein
MPWLDPLWMQRGLDALRETLDVDASTKRDMIEYLFEEGFWDRDRLSWDAAIARFNACLNPNKSEFFKLSELWALMKRFRRHQLLHTLAADLGCEVRVIPTEERRQALLERLADAQETLATAQQEIAAELARLSPGETVRLHPAVRAQDAKFSVEPGGF